MKEPAASADNHHPGGAAPSGASHSGLGSSAQDTGGSPVGGAHPGGRASTASGATRTQHTGPHANRLNASQRGWLAITGWVLYVLSWVTPSLDGRQSGATAFVDSVRLAWHFLSTDNVLAGLCVTLGWLANFSIFPRLPCWLRMVASALPWLAFAVVLAKVPARATFFLYFYPWALGIALIHAARCSSRKAAS